MKAVYWSAFITIVCLPLYLIRCRDFFFCISPLPFTLLEILILVTFGLWLIGKIKHKELDFTYFLKSPFFIPTLIFLLSATISMLISPTITAAAGIWKAYFIEPALLFLIITDLSRKKGDILWVVEALLLSGIWLSLISLLQPLFGIEIFDESAKAIGRIAGIYTTPNALALYLSPLIVLASGVVARKFVDRYGGDFVFQLSVVGLVLTIPTLYLTESRGGKLGVIAALTFFAVYLLLKYLGLLKKRMLYFVAGFFALFYFLFSAYLILGSGEKIQERQTKEFDSITSRYCLWQSATNMIEDSPVFGIGLSAFDKVYPKYATCEKTIYIYPHNLVLNFWLETGFLGLLSFFALMAVSIKKLIDTPGVLSGTLLAVLVYIFTHGLVDVPYFKNDLAAQMWVVFALIYSVNLLVGDKKGQS